MTFVSGIITVGSALSSSSCEISFHTKCSIPEISSFASRVNNKVFVRSGAGIVADSVPENEYQECINKAKAVINALKLSQSEN